MNFFLKNSIWKPNVNIDHVFDALAEGTNEVGSHLRLIDDQILNTGSSFYGGSGRSPFSYLLANTGESNFNRVHGNCLGWTACATITATKRTTQAVPYRIVNSNYAPYV